MSFEPWLNKKGIMHLPAKVPGRSLQRIRVTVYKPL